MQLKRIKTKKKNINKATKLMMINSFINCNHNNDNKDFNNRNNDNNDGNITTNKKINNNSINNDQRKKSR